MCFTLNVSYYYYCKVSHNFNPFRWVIGISCSETKITRTLAHIRFLCFSKRFPFRGYKRRQQVERNGNKRFWFTAIHTHIHSPVVHHHHGAHPTAIDSAKSEILQYVKDLYYIIIFFFQCDFFPPYPRPDYNITRTFPTCIVIYIHRVAYADIVCLCIVFVFAFTSARTRRGLHTLYELRSSNNRCWSVP